MSKKKTTVQPKTKRPKTKSEKVRKKTLPSAEGTRKVMKDLEGFSRLRVDTPGFPPGDMIRVITRENFEQILKKVSRPDQPKHQPDKESSETSE